MKKPKMRAELMEITPSLALRWLDLNTDNRNISDRWVDAIAADIAADKWDPNNASIGVRVNDKDEPQLVVDGQHRLWAVTQAKKSIWTWVIFGDDDSLRRDNIDRVKPRSIADQLQLIDHIPNASQVAAWAGVVMDLEEVGIGHKSMTLEQARAIRLRHLPAMEWLQTVVFGGNVAGRKRIRKAAVGGVFVYCYPTAPDRLDLFAKQVRDGENLTRSDPAYALRAYLEKVEQAKAGTETRAAKHEITVLTLRAVLAFIKGEQLTTLRAATILGGSFYRDACKYFARAHQKGVAPVRRAAGAK
jgi:hypothetical protein